MRLAYSDPLTNETQLQRASQVALGATFDDSIALIERIATARPDLPLVPMAYANQVPSAAAMAAPAARGRRASGWGLSSWRT